MKVVQRFYFELSQALGVLWTDSIFLFTAYTGSAASFFGDATICKHAYLRKDGSLTEKEIAKWKDDRILIIDELSFMKD